MLRFLREQEVYVVHVGPCPLSAREALKHGRLRGLRRIPHLSPVDLAIRRLVSGGTLAAEPAIQAAEHLLLEWKVASVVVGGHDRDSAALHVAHDPQLAGEVLGHSRYPILVVVELREPVVAVPPGVLLDVVQPRVLRLVGDLERPRACGVLLGVEAVTSQAAILGQHRPVFRDVEERARVRNNVLHLEASRGAAHQGEPMHELRTTTVACHDNVRQSRELPLIFEVREHLVHGLERRQATAPARAVHPIGPTPPAYGAHAVEPRVPLHLTVREEAHRHDVPIRLIGN
mmetsp:Transcript_93697/g.209874  ORF Transcript_93697/g.209874 Transcript_93697/m.209874 type:complete len:288 (+) Transcript_93697:222-1085(+)